MHWRTLGVGIRRDAHNDRSMETSRLGRFGKRSAMDRSFSDWCWGRNGGA